MKNDLQKRISLASIAALVAGILAMVPVAPANAATTVALDCTNAAASAGDAN